ncbi:YcxB family protein [Acutalibacter sp. 1XD8-33]|uniref:YcxB family protein n=1 Tax=Acutalibacter sp. 1XD8-33 TaxID=2320081 RepID=UPI000EA3AADF|nr:YcxB family protein [Acutalibacter sp. 1XD8-33]RKJ41612.1 YcxB family protein [Acutalibacter sp. 1XD8-33]
MKKTMMVLLAVLLLVALPMPASAETWVGLDFTLEIPEGFYQLGPELEEEDPAWALAGVSDPSARLREYDEMGVLVNLIPKEGKANISVMQKESDTTKRVHDLTLLSEEERTELLDKMTQSENPDVAITKGWQESGQNLFFWIQLDAGGNQEMHERLYGTIKNGHSLSIDLYNGEEPISQEQTELLLDLVDSVTFTQILEKPEPDVAGAYSSLALVALLLIAVIAPIIYVPVRGKIDKKKKAQLAEQLSEYHKTHGSNQVDGEAVFINSTDCTKEAIHHFSIYHAYFKNVGELIFGMLLCLIMVVSAFLMKTEWWMRLAAAGVTVYYAYKIISMPNNIEKIQRKVFGRGMSETAHFSFYPEAFRVSGIQSANVLPYFQITDVRRRGQYFYLYYGPDNAYMIDQYGFSRGEFEDFEKFIREKTGKQ